MIYRLVLLMSIFCTTCTVYMKDRNKLVTNIQSNKILANYINAHQIQGHIAENFYKKTNTDSLVFLHVTKPDEQSYPIDSIYFLFYTSSNYKLLAQSEFEKGLIYLEVDKNGNHKKYYDFGGYVLNTGNIKVLDNKTNLQITFETDIWGSTTSDTLKQFIKIESIKNSVDFKIWNRYNEKENWQVISIEEN